MARKEKVQALRVTLYLKAPPRKAWKAVTEGRHLGRWFTTPQKLELKKGGCWDFVGCPGKVVTVRKGKIFSHTHRFQNSDSRITYELKRMKNYTELSVTHDRFGTNKFMRACWQGAWPSILCNLKSYLETGSPMWETAFKCGEE